MANAASADQLLAEIRDVAEQWGKIACRRAFGEDGPGLDVNLTMMEEVAVAAARGLVAGTLQSSTQKQAQQLGSHQSCPDCQQSCLVRSEPREIQTRGGPFTYDEPVCHCTRCRRDFFPSTSGSATGRAGL